MCLNFYVSCMSVMHVTQFFELANYVCGGWANIFDTYLKRKVILICLWYFYQISLTVNLYNSSTCVNLFFAFKSFLIKQVRIFWIIVGKTTCIIIYNFNHICLLICNFFLWLIHFYEWVIFFSFFTQDYVIKIVK